MSATLAAAPTAPATGPAVGAAAPDRDLEVLRAQIASLLRRGDYVAATESARTLLERTEQEADEDSPPMADALDGVVGAAVLMGDGTTLDVRPLAERAVRIRERQFGKGSPEVATSLGNLAQVLVLADRPNEAMPSAQRALALVEARFGPHDPRVAHALKVKAMVEYGLYRHAESESLLRRALAILDASPERDPIEHAEIIYRLGRSLKAQQRFNEAALLLKRARGLCVELLGPHHPLAAAMERNLGDLYFLTGRYSEARSLFEHALGSLQSTTGRESPAVSRAFDSLAGVLWRLGDFQGARRAARRGLAIMEKVRGPVSPGIVDSLNHLALIEMDLENAGEARTLYERALGIAAAADLRYWQAALNHNLAELEFLKKDYVGAEASYQRALTIEISDLQDDLMTRASTLDSYSKLRAQTGDLEQATSLNAQALSLRERALGDEHHLFADTLNARAKIELARGSPATALRTALRAEAIGRAHFRRTAVRLSESEALRYQRIKISGLDVALSALVQVPDRLRTASLVTSVWDALIRSRALVLDEIASRHRSLRGSDDRRLSDLLETLRSARERLAQRVVAGPGGSGAKAYGQDVRRLEADVESAERSLAERSQPFRAARARAEAGWPEAKRALPRGTALVAYARFHAIGGPGRPIDFTPLEEVPASADEPLPSCYVAFVLSSGADRPILVPLPESEHLEDAVALWRNEADSLPKGLDLADSRAERDYRRAGERVREIAWDPVAVRISGARQVFVVPDGALHMVNLGALPASGDQYLVETGPLVHYLSAERDLLKAATRQPSGEGLLVLGDPDFDGIGLGPDSAATGWVSGATARVATDGGDPYRGAVPTCGTFRSLRFASLPGALVESEEIASLWRAARAGRGAGGGSVLKLTGPQATEEAFKRVAPRYRVVHVATHAFLIAEHCPVAFEERGEEPRDGEFEENPLLLSGLALAGANRRSGVPASAGGEDGILTGEEIASLDLSRVQWVVLSACETAGGLVRAGEGVLGLRRAFEVAGAGTLIMSLWPVEDSSTREWMRSLYQARLKGASTAAATRDASVAMISRLRRAGRSTHPHLWGAFVATGDWR